MLLIYIYKIKVLSVHWSKSRQILVSHVSSKITNENTLNKIPIIMFVWFPRKVTIHVKTAEGIIMKFHFWIRYLLTNVYSYITFWYFDPKRGFRGRTNGNYQIIPKLLTLGKFWYEQSCMGFWQLLVKKIPPKRGGG